MLLDENNTNTGYRMSERPTMKHYFEYFILKILILFLRILPYRHAVRFGGFIGRILWHWGIRKKVSRRNFELCFGADIDPKYRDRVLLKSYSNFCRTAVEFALFSKPRQKLNELVRIEGEELLQKIKEQGKGAILVTGHFGNWELYASAIVNAGCKVSIVAGTQKNPLVDKLMNNTRELMGLEIIHIGSAGIGIMKALRSGKMVALLSDQDAHEDGVIVKFFGQPASTPAGTAMLSVKIGCPIFSGYIVRNPDGLTHTGYVRRIDFPSAELDEQRNIQMLTQSYTEIVEEAVRKHPEQYFWAHRKFKTTLGY